jgi:hypothetical protein
MLPIQFDHLTWLSGTHTKETPPTRQRADLTRKLTRAMDGNKGLSCARGADNLKLARDNHKERRGAVSLLVKYFATLRRTHVPVRFNATNLRWC